MGRIKILFFSLFLFIGCSRAQVADPQNWKINSSLEPFKNGEKVLILSPHPDDEAIACAGIIQEALAAGAKLKIVYLTNGDHNELAFIVYGKRLVFRKQGFVYMGQIRQKEATRAMKYLGLSEKDLVFLGYPDFGTFNIFCNYWQSQRPFKDLLTRISYVPYKGDTRYGSPYTGENILNDITQQILDYRPDKIFVSHPADVNVDHKSLYLFSQVALSDLEGKIPKPKVYPYLVHCVGWPKPRHYHPELALYPPDKFKSPIDWQRFDLSFKQLDKKYQTILFYRSQTNTSAFYLFSFARSNELFGDYPVVELNPQAPSLKDKIISYFGSSEMFKETEGPDHQGQAEETGIVSYARENGYFIVKVEKSLRLSPKFRVLLYAFGYNKEIPFALMPKIRVITYGNKCKVFSAKERILDHNVMVKFSGNSLIIRIPLKILGDPDYLFTSLKAYHGNIPGDAVGFRKIQLK